MNSVAPDPKSPAYRKWKRRRERRRVEGSEPEIISLGIAQIAKENERETFAASENDNRSSKNDEMPDERRRNCRCHRRC